MLKHYLTVSSSANGESMSVLRRSLRLKPAVGAKSAGAGQPKFGALQRAFSSLSIPQFRTLWIGMFFSIGAMQIEIVARSWLAYELSGSAFILGLVAMARSIPLVALSPFAGVAADRFDRRKLLIASQSAMFVIALLNAVLVHLGVITVWQLFALGLVQGLAFPFTMPTRSAFMSVLVGKEHMANALALDSTGRNLNMIGAPAISGFLLAFNPTLAFYGIALMYALAVFTLFRLPGGSRGNVVRGGTLSQMFVGFKYVFGGPVLRMFMVLSMIPILIGMPFQQLLPVFQEDVLAVGPSVLGIMFAMVGLGALMGSLGAAYFSNSTRMGEAQAICGVIFGISLMLFALSTWLPLSLFALLLVGLTSQTYLTINRSLLMLNSDPSLYGRVMSIYVMQWYLMPVSLLPLGLLADRIGVAITVAAAGMLITLFIGTAVARKPAFFRPSDLTATARD